MENSHHVNGTFQIIHSENIRLALLDSLFHLELFKTNYFYNN